MEQRIIDAAREKEARERQLEQEQLLAKVRDIPITLAHDYMYSSYMYYMCIWSKNVSKQFEVNKKTTRTQCCLHNPCILIIMQ